MTKKSSIILSATIVFVISGYGLFMPIIPYLIATSNVNASIASLLLSFYALGQFVSSPIFGNYADHSGSKKTLLVGLIGYFSSLALSLSITNLTIMLALRLVSGVFAGACVSSVENYVGKLSTDEEKSQNYTFTSLSIAIGMTMGPLLGILYISNSYLIALIMGIIGVVIILLVLKQIVPDKVQVVDTKLTFGTLLSNLANASKDGRNRHVLQSFFLYGLITAGLEAIGIVYVMNFVQISLPVIILAGVYGVALGIYVLILSPKIINKFDKLKLSLNLIVVIVAGLILIMCTFSTYLIVLGTFIVIGSMTSLIICLTTLITEINTNSGLMLGARNSALSLGSIVGPIMLSATYDLIPSLTMLGLIVVAFIVWILGNQIRRTYE